MDELRQRLVNRGQDSEAVIARRMRDARSEISHADEFDFLIVNEDFSDALNSLRSIIRGEQPADPDEARRNREILARLLETG